jgi:hypothetical protein
MNIDRMKLTFNNPGIHTTLVVQTDINALTSILILKIIKGLVDQLRNRVIILTDQLPDPSESFLQKEKKSQG